MTNEPHPAVPTFDPANYDPTRGLYKFGKGELGGKAHGLALLNQQLQHPSFNSFKDSKGKKIRIVVPPALIITTEFFDMFLKQNQLDRQNLEEISDDHIAERFGRACLPEALDEVLRHYLRRNRGCLAVRSSGLMEDTRRFGYAGLYCSVMFPNDQPDIDQRLDRLRQAVKRVYASTFFKAPRAYALRLGHSSVKEKMAVILQPVIGSWHNDLFLPAISGIAQSVNFYPLPPMRHADGLVTMAVGMGQTVISGEKSLCFSPEYPQNLPQRSSVDEVLANSQTHFYALHRDRGDANEGDNKKGLLVRTALPAVADATFMRYVASTWDPAEERIRDTIQHDGARVVTFAPILKHRLFPLSEIITSLLKRGQGIMDCPVEMEFAVDFGQPPDSPATFGVLQLRPMSTRQTAGEVIIEENEIDNAFCYSKAAMGNSDDEAMADIVYIKPEQFDPARTREMVGQIARINAALTSQDRRYVLIGPGRWGSQDPWLGIPVRWQHISGVGAIVETGAPNLRVEFSQGAHLFHNLTVAGICYLSISDAPPDYLDRQWLAAQPKLTETDHVAHIRLRDRLRFKVDGRTARGLITINKIK